MEISSVTLSNDLTKLTVTITDAAGVLSLRYWNNDTYRDFTQAKDFTSKLTASATENIEITLAELNEDYFDGIYFFEAEDDDETSINYAYTLTKYRECVVDRIVQIKNCDSCPDVLDEGSKKVHALITALEYSLQDRRIDDMLNIVRMLDKYCDGGCKSCGQYGNVSTIESSNTNFNPISIILDGGSLD